MRPLQAISSKMCENFLTEERYSRLQLLSNKLRESVISSLIERQTMCWHASLLVMDTSQGEPSQDIRSLNEILFHCFGLLLFFGHETKAIYF